MSLYKLKSAPIVLIEDDTNKNLIPLIFELIHNEQNVQFFCYEQPASLWRNVFMNCSQVTCHDEFNIDLINTYTTTKCRIVIESVNQMSLCFGWNECLKCLTRLHRNPNVSQLVLILHKDCLPHSSKLQINLNHLASATVSFDTIDNTKIYVQLKKGGKFVKSEENLWYDVKNRVLKSTAIIKEDKEEEVSEKPMPANLTTFKIEMEQIHKFEKFKIKLPYMSKQEGESKVFYEPDAVDDWDEEDPDEDLDI